MGIVKGTNENFSELISNGVVLVDFFATWCGPCKMLSPILEEISTEQLKMNIIKIDIDENEKLCKQYGIMSVPTLILFKDGKMIDSKIGYCTKDELLEWINSN